MTAVLLGVLSTELYIHRLPASANFAEVLSAIDCSSIASGETSSLFATLQSAEELSIVCDSRLALNADRRSGPWRALRVLGELDFALTGILSSIAAPLAAADISIFAISSYDTDYVLVRSETLPQAIQVLLDTGFPVTQESF